MKRLPQIVGGTFEFSLDSCFVRVMDVGRHYHKDLSWPLYAANSDTDKSDHGVNHPGLLSFVFS
jgi:hypothetical protein